MFVRQELARRHVNQLPDGDRDRPSAAGLIASSAAVFRWSETPQTALSAAVLLLVPGVPLINAAEDMIKGHMVVGLVRGATGVLVSLAIALGLLLAMTLAGVRGL
jgi:Uncharacterized conserved protein